MKKSKTPVEVLKEAKKIVTKGWCQGHYAVDKKGGIVSEYSRAVSKCCATGAIFRAAGMQHSTVAFSFLEKVIPHRAGESSSIPTWNDNKRRTKKQVLKAFDRAIKAAEKAEKTSTQVI